MPVISGLTYTTTDTTIVAVWTTDVSADSNLSAGGKNAIDNGVAASGTSHQCIVTGLLPNTTYSCFVTSGGTRSIPQNVTTNSRPTRKTVLGATLGAPTQTANAPQGDTYRSFVSSDNNTYMTQDDGNGFVNNSANSGYNTQLGLITNETTMAGTFISLANYLAFNTSAGTDGPAGAAMVNKSTGLIGMNGNLHEIVYRQFPPTYSTNRYANVIKSTNHGTSWNNFNATSTFTAGGNVLTPQSPSEPVQFYTSLLGRISPVLYAADDGTLGYNTAGNQIDGGNAYVYLHYFQDSNSNLYLMRIPRISFDLQSFTFEYWVGSATPAIADFTNQGNWTSTEGSETSLLTIANVWAQAIYVPTINRYILSTWNTGTPAGTVLQFFEAPTPAGPFTLVCAQQCAIVGHQWYGPFPFHRDVLGNSATDAIPVRMVFQGEPGKGSYQPNVATLTLLTTYLPMQQLISYGFTTVENPLSDGGNFTKCPVFSDLKVTSSGVCTSTVGSAVACGDYWNAAVPTGDTGGTWPANQYGEVTIGTIVATDSYIVGVRQSISAETAYYIIGLATTASPAAANTVLYAFVAGTAHNLQTTSMTISTGDVIRLSVVGNVLTITQNGSLLNTFTDTNNYVTAAGSGPACGIISNTTASLSNISKFAGGANQAVSPTFSGSAPTITVSSVSGGTIYYTTNGTTPTRSSSSVSSGSTVSVPAGKTLKAMTSATGLADSAVTSQAFTGTKTTHQQLRQWREGRR